MTKDVTNDEQQKSNTETESTDVQRPGTDETSQVTAELEAVKAELAANKQLLEKVRKFEEENKKAAERALKEQGKFKELYEAEVAKRAEIENKLRTKAVTTAVQQVLKESGARSVQTVARLIDVSQIDVGEDFEVNVDTVKKLVDEIKTSDPILFGEVTEGGSNKKTEAPSVKRSADSPTVSSYETEIRAATSSKQIEAVMRKYGKLN